MIKEKIHFGKDLLQFMRNNGLTEYGSLLSQKVLYEVLDIHKPKIATEQVFKEINFIILGATDYVRVQMMKEGKAFSQIKGSFRIPLICENMKVCESYVLSADKKLKRSAQLMRNTPSIDGPTSLEQAQELAKILGKREHIKKLNQRRDNLK